jgi:hypothetical protein
MCATLASIVVRTGGAGSGAVLNRDAPGPGF